MFIYEAYVLAERGYEEGEEDEEDEEDEEGEEDEDEEGKKRFRIINCRRVVSADRLGAAGTFRSFASRMICFSGVLKQQAELIMSSAFFKFVELIDDIVLDLKSE